ncbi:MAG: hypothetical protein COU52_03340 [Candidatus Omnitrophica bacterium CG10_big_fil_rev_8_21_14_0_10_43_8]|nr:MAG: hypothetical protein COU52_03340 [Candidatus Omnitrophica bacterium CG10_big_fil_rev_8_21_14_0_10_43_8]
MKKQSNKYNTFIISLSLVGSMVLLGLGADVFSVSWRQLIKPVFVKEVKKEGVDFILVDDFEKGQSSGVFYERKNSIGGYQGTWAKRPSYSIITKLSDERDSARGRYLAIEYKKEAGWAGWYTLLNNADISNYNALTFWVKGDKGGEKFDIGLADAKMQEFQMDAVYAGPIDLFLPLGVTTEWQKVKIPVSRVESQIDLNKMGSIVLWFKYGGEGKVYIDDMEFESDKEVQKKEAFNSPKANFDPKHPRSLWVWKVDPVTNQKGRKELLQLCKDAAITNMYLYFGDFDPEKEPEYASGLADFLKEAHKFGIKVEALTGNPVWALKVYHQSCLDWIDAFLKFNKTRPQNERIDGVSLDVEPYLTSEWQSDTDRVRSDYIDLLKKVRKLVLRYNQEFKIGVAIPHFYSEIDKGKFEEKTLELVDYAVVMAYYDDPNKIIEKSAPHFVIADKLGKKISIGVETQDLIALNQGERRQTFFEEGWEEMEDSLAQVSKKFKSHPSFEGFAIHCYYSYKLLQRGRNVPIKQRPKDIYSIVSKRRLSNIKIDGNLSDWDLSSMYAVDKKVNVVYGQFSWAGPNDLSAKIYSMWDDGNLYFAFDITDDVIEQEKAKHDLWEGDHIEMWLDMNLMADYNEAINSNDDYQFGFSPGNLKKLKSEVYTWTPELSNMDYTKEIEIASAKTEKGYVIEVKLPARVLYASRDTRQPVNLRRSVWFKNGDKFGISVDPSDCDDPAAPQKVLMSSSVSRAWGDPTTFGILELK